MGKVPSQARSRRDLRLLCRHSSARPICNFVSVAVVCLFVFCGPELSVLPADILKVPPSVGL